MTLVMPAHLFNILKHSWAVAPLKFAKLKYIEILIMLNGRRGSGMKDFIVYRWSVDDYIAFKKGLSNWQHDVGCGEKQKQEHRTRHI